MEAVGSEVIVVMTVPFLFLGGLLIYYWDSLLSFLRYQFSAEARM
jgi:hypothetical protein